MRKKNSRLEIVQRNQIILNNIQQAEADKCRSGLLKKGYILFKEAKDRGFRRIGYDVYQRKEDVDAGNIWAVEKVDGEDWLVCYTDQNDRILRNLKTAAKNHRMQKTAVIKDAVVMAPGDLVEITPRHAESVHNKYRGKKGEVTAAMPDRSQLTFKDGSSLWIENTDLTVVKDRRELSVGDTVRMFSRKDIEGQVTKYSYGDKYITFEGGAGQKFVARISDICKITKTGLVVQNIFTDPTNPDEQKLLKEYMRGQLQQTQQPGMETPQQTLETAMAPGGVGGEMGEGFPPSIKAQPSSAEMSAGTAVPASQFMSKEFNFAGFVKKGRRLNVGDMIQRKSTGENGTIVNVSFDRKLGKFYMIDFGAQEPDLVYDTDIMKISPTKGPGAPTPAFPTDVTPMRFPGGGGERSTETPIQQVVSKKAVLGPQFDTVKTAALEFVEGMVAQALKNHEADSPGEVVTGEFENELVKQAITTYMSRYLPENLIQALSATDKNELSEWLFVEAANIEAEAPTTEEFISEEPVTETDMWDLEANYKNTRTREREIAAGKLSNELQQHVKVAIIAPTKLSTFRDKQKFVRDAVYAMIKSGMLVDAAHLIAQHVVSIENINFPLLRRCIAQMGYQHVDQVIETAGDVFAFTTFSTADGKKFALDLPGMETLRGGGGGYPGGMDIEPMKWEVKSPQPGDLDRGRLEEALQENLVDQSVPFEQAAPKINIELDPENKKIIIDYEQEEEPPIELAGTEEAPLVSGEELSKTPKPGMPPMETRTKPEGGATDFAGGFEVPVTF